jgi:glycine dehydrogenase subunit 2
VAVEPLLWELGAPGRKGYVFPPLDVPGEIEDYLPEAYRRRKDAELPELSEIEVVRHFTHLSSKNYGVDTSFYPLGSCTMKYNPKVNEVAASLPGFTDLHPYLGRWSLCITCKSIWPKLPVWTP